MAGSRSLSDLTPDEQPGSSFNVVVVRRTGEELDEEQLRRSLARFRNCSLSFRRFTLSADPPCFRSIRTLITRSTIGCGFGPRSSFRAT